MKCRAKRQAGLAGFRKDFRTTDQVFIIQILIQQARQEKRKLYSRFVDFKKAFDLVPRQTLWKVLEQRGMPGREGVAPRTALHILDREMLGPNLWPAAIHCAVLLAACSTAQSTAG